MADKDMDAIKQDKETAKQGSVWNRLFATKPKPAVVKEPPKSVNTGIELTPEERDEVAKPVSSKPAKYANGGLVSHMHHLKSRGKAMK